MTVIDPLIDANEAAKILDVSSSTYWRWVRLGKLPKPVKMGALSRWPRSEVIAIVEGAKAKRNAA